MRRRLGNRETEKRHRDVDRHRKECRDGDVVEAEQVETSQHASDNCTGNVSTVKVAHPGDAVRCCLDPTRDRRQSGPINIVGGNRQMPATKPRRSMPLKPDPAQGIRPADQRHCVQNNQAHHADPHLEQRVYPERMMHRRDKPRKEETAQHMPPMKVPSNTPSEPKTIQ